MAAEPLDIVCLADMPWDYPLWTNRQHVMSRVPTRDPNARVLYVSPPRFVVSALRSRRRPVRAEAGSPLWTERKGERLWVVQPLLPLPNRLLQRHVPALYDRWTAAAVRHASRRLGFERVVLWSYTPFAEGIVGRLGEEIVVYDVVDDYPALPHYQQLRPGVVAADTEMTRRADLVFHTSETVFAARAPLNPASHLVGNAADVDLFATAQSGRHEVPAELAEIARPRLLFHGAVTGYKLDLELIGRLADAHPEWSLVFVGPVLDDEAGAALSGRTNVHLLGARRQDELPALLAGADVCIIPYRRTAYTEGINALKLYECLAAGKRIVATDLPCFAPFRDLVSLATDADGFGRSVGEQLAASGVDDRAERLRRVRPFSWDGKVDAMLGLLRSRLPPAASRTGR